MNDVVKITDYVDVKIWKYVMPYDIVLDTWFGAKRLIRGRVWNGASGVPDLDMESSALHDDLYAYPVMDSGDRISKIQCDILYGQFLYRASEKTKLRGSRFYNKISYHFRKRYRRIAAIMRPIGLHFVGNKAWKKHRITEKKLGDQYQEWMSQKYYVPRKACWDFPSFHTKHAIWSE